MDKFREKSRRRPGMLGLRKIASGTEIAVAAPDSPAQLRQGFA